MAYRIRYRRNKRTVQKASGGLLVRSAIACAMLLALLFWNETGGRNRQALRQWFLPGQLERAAMAYAEGVSAYQVLLNQCRQLVKEGGYG